MKLILDEAESRALRTFLEAQREPVVASVVASIEVRRAAKRARREREAGDRLDGIVWISLAPEIVDLAARLDPPELRSLDAVHLATALHLRAQLGAFVAYDRRLLGAARAVGLETVSPT